MTERQMIRAIVCGRYNLNALLCAPCSTTLTWYEADLIVIHPTGWMDEIEVKLNLRDFRADKKKDKHKKLRGVRESQARPNYVRRFWYAVPLELEAQVLSELPEHAGLLTVDGFTVRAVVDAPVLESEKVTPEQRMRVLKSAYHRHWNLFFDQAKRETA